MLKDVIEHAFTMYWLPGAERVLLRHSTVKIDRDIIVNKKGEIQLASGQ
jgi:hypothetical protein